MTLTVAIVLWIVGALIAWAFIAGAHKGNRDAR
jgi:hypothetical protein